MRNLLLGLLLAFASTNAFAAASNAVAIATSNSPQTINTNDPVEIEYQRILADDDAAQTEADKWIRDSKAFAEKGAANPTTTLNLRIRQRFDTVQKAYESFLLRHPDHVRARLAFGSFLNDGGEEESAVVQWEKARELDPKNPATWNNLANYYGHKGPVTNAFEYYGKAIELKPDEALYYQNLATHVYLFRSEAQAYYHLTEPEVFDKSLELYRKALKLDPGNFILATDYAQSFYGINPPRYKEGLKAWQDTLKIAGDDIERQGVYIHLARIEMKLGLFHEARQHLDAVTNEMYAVSKTKLSQNLTNALEKVTNSAPPTVNKTN